jgi:oligopeptidase B
VWVDATKSTCDPADPKTNMQDPVTGAPLPVRIPVTIWYRRDKFVRGANPLILYGYGSYGMSCDPTFTSEKLSLLDRGVVYALAAIRGGGEMGRTWRNAGRMEHKMNTFTDFIDCAEAMRAQGWCHPDRLAIRGGSAGGLLVGACLSFRPDLFRAVSALVPFVDVVTTMSDASIPLTTGEWDEWGNPLTSPEARARMLAYSPMDNLPDASVVMPHLYIESGLGDPRVQYFEPAAWGASLRLRWDASRAQGRAIVHKCNMNAGHGGASGRYQQLEELANEYAFLLLALGVDI